MSDMPTSASRLASSPFRFIYHRLVSLSYSTHTLEKSSNPFLDPLSTPSTCLALGKFGTLLSASRVFICACLRDGAAPVPALNAFAAPRLEVPFACVCVCHT